MSLFRLLGFSYYKSFYTNGRSYITICFRIGKNRFELFEFGLRGDWRDAYYVGNYCIGRKGIKELNNRVR